MPDPVEGFTDITKYNLNVFPFIQGPEESVVNIYELVHCRVPTGKPRLEWRNYLIIKEKFMYMFIDSFSQRFSPLSYLVI